MHEKEFLHIIREHQGIIHKISQVYRDLKEDREDLFQEIVFQLWKSYPSFQHKSKVSSWMYRIALNTAIATYRKKKPEIVFTTTLPEQADEAGDENEAARKDRLLHVIRQLDDAEKAIITLYLEDMNYQEIAEVTGINENYVGVKLNRIKSKIKKQLN